MREGEINYIKQLVLEYGALAAKSLEAKDEQQQVNIAAERKRIEDQLGMSAEEILRFAADFTIKE